MDEKLASMLQVEPMTLSRMNRKSHSQQSRLLGTSDLCELSGEKGQLSIKSFLTPKSSCEFVGIPGQKELDQTGV